MTTTTDTLTTVTFTAPLWPADLAGPRQLQKTNPLTADQVAEFRAIAEVAGFDIVAELH